MKVKACEYCGPDKQTGLPGGACESCMNTGLKYPQMGEYMEIHKSSKPVYQVENCGVWEDVTEKEQSRCKDLAYRTRTLWISPSEIHSKLDKAIELMQYLMEAPGVSALMQSKIDFALYEIDENHSKKQY